MAANENPTDPLAFVKNMWSSMGIKLPGMMVPTIDPNELDKRIKDLRAVEGWLRMNLNMLSATINTLEVQRATLSALSSFRQAATSGEKPQPAARPAPPPEPAPAAEPVPAAEVSPDQAANPFVIPPSMWPWNLIQQAAAQSPEAAAAPAKPDSGERKAP